MILLMESGSCLVFTCPETGDIQQRKRRRAKRLITSRKKKIMITAAVCLAALIIFAGIFYPGSEKKPGKPLVKVMDNAVDLQVVNVHYTEATSEGVKWEVKADSAQYRKKENLAVFKNPSIKLTMVNGRSYVMSGREGWLRQDTKDMEISGGIQLLSNNGDSFKTEQLSYTGAEKKCYTPGPVTIKNSRIQIEAQGMSLSLKDEHLTLHSGVRAYLQ